jgi:hypothetical protein
MENKQTYSVKKQEYTTLPNPNHPKHPMRQAHYVTVKAGLTWAEAKEMRKKDRSLSIFAEFPKPVVQP